MTLTPRWTSAVVSATTITDSDNHGKFIYKFLEHLFSSLNIISVFTAMNLILLVIYESIDS